ncbi:hypothetical protein L1987_67414 [Smallanthus sonchifolius]|uniref:Uncharacterized protein n=1 Tax=Smallanthus sonchifolius TaxID=185202 RepID=A0ACB9B1Z9_9ASTR|nr:hypothetical protein L1987_67414 [Smallanthus sonchifolius]
MIPLLLFWAILLAGYDAVSSIRDERSMASVGNCRHASHGWKLQLCKWDRLLVLVGRSERDFLNNYMLEMEVPVQPVSCSLCSLEVEDVEHAFIRCPVAATI